MYCREINTATLLHRDERIRMHIEASREASTFLSSFRDVEAKTWLLESGPEQTGS
jgi:hypothetical protein